MTNEHKQTEHPGLMRFTPPAGTSSGSGYLTLDPGTLLRIWVPYSGSGYLTQDPVTCLRIRLPDSGSPRPSWLVVSPGPRCSAPCLYPGSASPGPGGTPSADGQTEPRR